MFFLLRCPNCGERCMYECRYGSEFLEPPSPQTSWEQAVDHLYMRRTPDLVKPFSHFRFYENKLIGQKLPPRDHRELVQHIIFKTLFLRQLDRSVGPVHWLRSRK